ncbi:hypothetical protein EC957_006925 [Mortierella hygrophila]|uniref:Uncharacterized protein n=1 Tax=Mortierella hygrophila TaxID=979708 RepID=A0A9P6EZ14_9FUNG|nr:hypothetical protein EC957_006925 [Mortierella hygrophila]
MLTTLLLISLLTFLPIPSRAAETSNSSGGNQIQFPANSLSCVACQPAFSSSACQTILSSISSSSSSSLSNSTLAACQCSSSFLSLYSSCVKCFTETNQVSLVFGSPQAPAQSSLEDYCKAMPTSVAVQGGGGSASATITVTKTTTATGEPTTSPTRPSSAMSLIKGGQLGLGYYAALTIACLAFFSSLP